MYGSRLADDQHYDDSIQCRVAPVKQLPGLDVFSQPLKHRLGNAYSCRCCSADDVWSGLLAIAILAFSTTSCGRLCCDVYYRTMAETGFAGAA